MRWFRFILSHSIFISICAFALCYQTYILLHIQPDAVINSFVFFSTLCSYNLYWLLSKYSFGKPASFLVFFKKNCSYILLFVMAGVGMVLSLFYRPLIYPYVVIAVLLTLLYSLPLWPFKWTVYFKKAGFLKTILLAFTWTFVTLLIPASPVLETTIVPVAALFLARFLFMMMLCLIFDIRDVSVDKMLGLHSLATDLNRKTIKRIMQLSFIMYMAAGLFVKYQFEDNNQLCAFGITGLAIWRVYRLSLKQQGYLFYYFIVDGLILFSAVASYIASFFNFSLN